MAAKSNFKMTSYAEWESKATLKRAFLKFRVALFQRYIESCQKTKNQKKKKEKNYNKMLNRISIYLVSNFLSGPQIFSTILDEFPKSHMPKLFLLFLATFLNGNNSFFIVFF